MFKKYSVDERKRSWGLCCLFKFGRTIIVADEKSLKVLSSPIVALANHIVQLNLRVFCFFFFIFCSLIFI